MATVERLDSAHVEFAVVILSLWHNHHSNHMHAWPHVVLVLLIEVSHVLLKLWGGMIAVFYLWVCWFCRFRMCKLAVPWHRLAVGVYSIGSVYV